MEQVENAPRAAIAFAEGVDAFKLEVRHGHADEGIGGAGFIGQVKVFEEVSHQARDFVGVLGRNVDDGTSVLVFEHGAREGAQADAALE